MRPKFNKHFISISGPASRFPYHHWQKLITKAKVNICRQRCQKLLTLKRQDHRWDHSTLRKMFSAAAWRQPHLPGCSPNPLSPEVRCRMRTKWGKNWLSLNLRIDSWKWRSKILVKTKIGCRHSILRVQGYVLVQRWKDQLQQQVLIASLSIWRMNWKMKKSLAKNFQTRSMR